MKDTRPISKLIKHGEKKTEDGIEFPPEAFLFVPDATKPSTWKLRIWADLENRVTTSQLGAAAAALSPGGFRGNRVQLPPGEEEGIKKKLVLEYRKLGIEDKDIPQHLFSAHTDDDKKKNLKLHTAEIKNVEVLGIGSWVDMSGKKLNITDNDLDQFIDNFKNGVREPVLNLDHDSRLSEKVRNTLNTVSLGFVSSLKKIGDKLVADFKEVPAKLAELIQSGQLKKRSAEFFQKGFKLNGKLFDNVLMAVSFFGKDAPAINTLNNEFEVIFDVLMKKTEQPQGDTVIINLQGGSKVEITKEEHEEYIRLKSNSESSQTVVSELKKNEESLKEKVSGLEKEKEDTDKKTKDLEKFKTDYEKEKETALKKEAEDYVSLQIKEGKILPAHKDMYVEDYISKSSDETKFKMFKEDLEKRDKMLELGEMKDEKGNIIPDKVDFNSTEKMDEAIELWLKQNPGKEWEDGAVALKFMTKEEVT